MLGMKINAAKSNFFDRAKVINAVDKAARKILSKVGAFIRQDAKQSIRPARMKPLGALSEKERKSYERRVREWKARGKGGPKPRRPLQHSRPGDPPRSILGLLRKLIFFVWDPARKSVVIGPAKINSKSDAPSALEHGAGKIRRRPYMQPAYERNKAKIAAMWRNSVKG